MTLRARVRDFAYRRVGGSVAILVYHRVADLPSDPQLLAVTPDRFDEHVTMLAERFRVLPLTDVAEGLGIRSLPKRAVAITFDDGYADNLHNAAPILERHGLPATVFVSSGHTDAAHEYWWDELERLILGPTTLPERLDVEAGGTRFHAELGDDCEYAPDKAIEHARWDVTAPPPTARHRLYLDLAAFIRPLGVTQRQRALEALRAAVGDDGAPRSTHLPLAAAEVAKLAARPGMDVGGHTVDHVRLAALPAHEQLDEISKDRARLAELLGEAPRTFAYPYGAFGDFDDDSTAAVKAAGYEIACANYPRTVKPWSDPYRVPRFLVRGWDSQELARRLDTWFAGPGVHEGADGDR